MKKIRLSFVFILTLILMFCLSACLKEIVVNRPADQPYSKWISEDKAIYFETDKNGAGYGTLTVGDEVIDIHFATGCARVINIYIMEDDESGDLIESWTGNFKKEDRFTATVTKKTTYYEMGEKIVFYRVD